MIKKYALLLIAMCFACSSDFNELTLNPNSEKETFTHSKTSSSLWSLQTDLMKLYHINNSTPALLSDKISLLDSLANNLPEFVNLKSNQYISISTDDVDFILLNYDQLYQNLNQTPEFLDILDTIVLTDFDFNSIETEIINSNNLTVDEKELLLLIAYNSYENGDLSWKKRKGISIIYGYNLSKANAVFNAALFSLLD